MLVIKATETEAEKVFEFTSRWDMNKERIPELEDMEVGIPKWKSSLKKDLKWKEQSIELWDKNKVYNMQIMEPQKEKTRTKAKLEAIMIKVLY